MKGRRIGEYCVGFALLFSTSAVPRATALGTAFTYQGQLQQSGSPATGSCDLQFTLFDAAGGGAPPAGGNQIGNTVAENSVGVSDGVFTVQLDFGVNAFSSGNDRWLQVAVRCPAGGGALQVLAPRQPLTPAPYALFAGVVADGSVTSTKIGAGAVTTSQLATNAVTSAQIADGTVAMNDLADGAVSTTKIGNGQVTAAKLVAPLTLTASAANSFVGAFDGVSTGLNSVGVSGTANNGDNASGVYGHSDTGYGVVGSSAGGIGVLGRLIGNPAARGLVMAGAGVAGESSSGEGVRGTSHNGIGVLGRGTGAAGVSGTSNEDGVFGESTGDSGVGVHGMVQGPDATGVEGDSAGGVGVLGHSDDNDGVHGTSEKEDGTGVHGTANNGSLARGVFGESTNGAGVYGLSTNYGVAGFGGLSGVYGVATTSAGTGVLGVTNVFGSDSAAAIAVQGAATSGVGVRGDSVTATGVYGKSLAVSTFTTAGVVGEAAGNNGIGVRGVANTGTNAWGTFGESAHGAGVVGQSTDGSLFLGVNPSVKFRVASNGNVFADGSYNCGLNSSCFNSGIGADVAERIDTTEAVHPGDLVEIDPLHADHYRLAATASSTLVAGVVSTTPGMTMNNNDLTDNDVGVRTDMRPLLALVGKVPVKATAEGGAIRPGDLLVASSTPGHAMKAASSPAVGSIVGKALEPLDGSGVIKMLVMLR